MGRWKAVIPIVLALVIAVSGSFFLYDWMMSQQAPKETVKVESEAVPVAVAAVDLPWGTKLTPEMVKMVPYLKESLPNGHFSKAAQLKDRVVIAQVKANEAIVEHRLAPDSVSTGGVSAIVEPGMRAIAVKGDKIIGISGFIRPGNRVDVLTTLKDPRTKREMTKTVLEKILVLATGTEMQENDKGEPAPVDVYTLQVTPEEGEKLSLAASEGKLQFALRNVLDAETIFTKGATIPKTLSSLSKPEPKKGRPRINPTFTVEVIKGSDVNQKKLKL